MRVVVDAMRVHKINPGIRECTTVACKIVGQFPGSFLDCTDDGEKLGCGYSSIVRQIKCRVDHLNRNNTLARVTRAARTAKHSGDICTSTSVRSTCTTADAYGCILWQPTEPEEGETEASLENKRKEPIGFFEKEGPGVACTAGATELMSQTYYLQRKDINASPSLTIPDLLQRWPLLFVPKFLLWHFDKLTGKSIFDCMSDAFRRKGRRIRDYFVSRGDSNKKDVRAVFCELQNNTDDTASEEAGIIRILMAHFGEKESPLFLLYGVSFRFCIKYFSI